MTPPAPSSDSRSHAVDELVALSTALGHPDKDLAILGEGNTSVRESDESFWVKASGMNLGSATRESFVQVDFGRALAMLDDELSDDEDLRQRLAATRVDAGVEVMPSVETVVHAVCLSVDGVRFVGHTHPTPINMITCSQRYEELLSGRLFPDEIVLCGPVPLLIGYIDPGLPLAREIRRRLREHMEQHGERPKVIYMQNHGFIALGATPKQVLDTTAMAVKAARILVGTGALGGPRFLPPEEVRRIHDRPDEHYRQRVLGQR